MNTGVRTGRCRTVRRWQDGSRGWQEAREEKVGEASYRKVRDDHSL